MNVLQIFESPFDVQINETDIIIINWEMPRPEMKIRSDELQVATIEIVVNDSDPT
jgi:hypothetical protein